MSKSYALCCSEVGYDESKVAPPEQLKHWYAYVDGKAIKCANQADAKKYKLNECVLDPTSKQAIIEYWDSRRVLEVKALELFQKYLREDYSYLSDAMFEHCYNAAKERSKSADYDEIPDNLTYFVEFAKNAVKIGK
jgi:hypothetical protein